MSIPDTSEASNPAKHGASCGSYPAAPCSVSYKFRTFQEAVDRIPTDKIRECFDEMGKTFAVAKAFAEAQYEIAAALAKADGKEFPAMPASLLQLPDEHEWVDDGKGECVADIVGVARIEITQNPTGQPRAASARSVGPGCSTLNSGGSNANL